MRRHAFRRRIFPPVRTARAWPHFLRHRPLLLCCVALIAGMMVAAWLKPGMLAFAFVALGAGIVVAAAALLAPRMALAPLVVGFLALGGIVYEHRAAVPPTDLSKLAGAHHLVVEGTVISPPDEGGWRRRVRVEVAAAKSGDRAVNDVTGRAEVTVPREPVLSVGDRVLLRGVSVELPEAPEGPDEFDYRNWLARQGVHSVATAREVVVVGTARSVSATLTRVGVHLRERAVDAIEKTMPGVDAPLYSRLMVGMAYGLDAAPLPDEVVEQFRRAGTVHLLVVSGAQVSMVAIFLIAATGGWVRGLRPAQAICAASGVLVLVVVVGMEASVARAVAMFALVLLAAMTGRDYDVYTAVTIAAAVILLTDPLALVSLSFQLTFAATLGVIVFLPADAIRRVGGTVAAQPLPAVRAVIWGTVGAWVMTVPLLAHSFSGFALSGNLANLVNVPLSGIVLGAGFVALPLALVPSLDPLLWLCCCVARGLLAVVMYVNELAANLPMPFVEDVHFGVGAMIAWYVAVAVVVGLGLRDRAHYALDSVLLLPHPSWPTAAGVAMMSALGCSMALTGARPDALEMTLLPVGAGQCAMVRSSSGSTLMVDCGGGANLAQSGQEIADGVIVPWLARRRIERLDAVAITHWDTDHCNALPRVLSLVPAKMLLTPPPLVSDAEPPPGIRALQPPRRAAAGGRLTLGDGVSAELLAPRMPLLRGTGDDANANSVVMMVTHGRTRILLTGDIDASGAKRLIRDAQNAGRSLRADVLVLPHHGRGLAEVEALLDAVRPRWAIASCDDDADRYLGEAELALLRERSIELLRTDEHGAVRVLSDGRRITVNVSRGSRSLGQWVAAARG